LAIAEFLKAKDILCSFICRDHPGNLIEHIELKGFPVFGLTNRIEDGEYNFSPSRGLLKHGSWLGTDWLADAEETKEAIGVQKCDWLVVDHYALDSRWESELRECCDRLMALDDLADRNHECDLLLDQNYFPNPKRRYQHRIPASTTCLFGPTYAVMRDEYWEAHLVAHIRRGSISNILVYFGGADKNNVTERAMTALASSEEDSIRIDVVVDPGHKYLDSIKKSAERLTNVKLHIGVPTLCPLMMKADLAIGGAGTTSWERCSVGLPALVISTAENQRAVARELHAGGFIEWLGHEDQVATGSIEEGIRLIKETKTLETWSRRCWDLVDGRGVERVGFFLNAGPQSKLTARAINERDESLVLRWANDPIVRKNAFSSRTISEDEHRDWFHMVLKNQEHRGFYIVEGSADVPVGQVRFDRVQAGWEVTYSIDQIFRSRGLGSNVLGVAIEKFKLERGRTPIIGKVRTNNLASMKVFERLGFLRTEKATQFVTYRLD
jgi:UDP-2,4-diacetamido-2,4,6-trideoxy-beta-L-altropyranose hydrolase